MATTLLPTLRWPRLVPAKLPWLPCCALTAVAMLAALLLARRAAGALVQPLAWPALFSLAAGVLLVRLLGHRGAIENRWSAVGHSGFTCALLVMLASLWLPQSAVLPLLICFVGLVGVEAWCWQAVLSLPKESPAMPASATEQSTALDEGEEGFDPGLLSHIERRALAEGGEQIVGSLVAAFATHQRTLDLHLPFCPPLATLPTVEAETVEGPAARVRVVQVLANGARLEVRLDEPAFEPTRVLVQVLALAAPH